MYYNEYMIYTCTTNPSLDYYISLDEDLKNGETTRSNFENYDCGGKGVNVSIILSNLNIPSNTLGFLGGFTKDFYVSFLTQYPFIQPMFTSISESTRINVKIMGNKETSINAKGPKIKDDEFDKFKTRISRIYSDDIFVLSGNIQTEIQERICDLIHDLNEDGIKTVLDCSEEVIDKCIDIKPFMVNMNHIVDDNDSDEIIKNKLLEINKNGATNVFVCRRNKPSYICFNSEVYKSVPNKNESYVTGYIDAFIGGFIFTVVRGGNSLEGFKYGQAASIATSLSKDLAARSKIEEVYKEIEVIKI